ncbi:uncharacterized protein N7511_003392 [Penicillium nucicola]|uniref:uncharacterized protein n=1 Tax=Penicillium nucicola TaxID=1850975 RepID=UPI0025450854|nr:uncharacterized protein N7511_003392 [Penicillium nucicola]KAJ5771341.1 hypothetical protein N7511_003392 [Penicillium nucicola]
MMSIQCQTRSDIQPTRLTSSTVNIDTMTTEVYDVTLSYSSSSSSSSSSFSSSVYSTTSSTPTLVWDLLTPKQRANITQWIDSTPYYDSMEEEEEKSSCNSSNETLVLEDLGPIQLEAVPPFPRPNLTGSSLYQLHNQLRHPHTSRFTELMDEDLIDPRLVPVAADSDSDINGSMLPFLYKPTPIPSQSATPEPEFAIVLIAQFVSKKARSVVGHACRGLRKKLARDKGLDK